MWKDISFAKGEYQVSLEGEVRSLDRYIQYPNHKQFKKGQPIKGVPNSKGYLRATIKGKAYFIHRLVATEFIENPNNLPHVNHIDGDKLNNCASNLEWITNSENLKHAYRTGIAVSLKGEEKLGAILTEEQVVWILKNYQKGSREFGRKPLARKFAVSHQTIKNIIDRTRWKHVQL